MENRGFDVIKIELFNLGWYLGVIVILQFAASFMALLTNLRASLDKRSPPPAQLVIFKCNNKFVL